MKQQDGVETGDAFFDDFRNAKLTVSDVIAYYAALVYRKTGSYEAAARQLQLDRRTVKAKVQEFLSAQGATTG